MAVSFIGGGNRENHWSATSHWQTLSHNVVSSTPCHEITTSVMIGTDCTGSCKSNCLPYDHDYEISEVKHS